MRSLAKLFLLVLAFSVLIAARYPPLRIEEEDGSPAGVVTKMKFDNGGLTKNGTIWTFNIPTAGRSLTEAAGSPGTYDADAELYTEKSGVRIESPIVEDLDKIFYFMNAVTVTRVWCITDTGTADINIENDAGTDILSAELVCDAGEQTSCASGCDVNTIQLAQDNIAALNNANISVSATATSPTVLTVYVGYTKDD